MLQKSIACLLFVLMTTPLHLNSATGEEWIVPIAGNTFPAIGQKTDEGIRRGGRLAWANLESRFEIYFHIDRPAKIKLSINARVASGTSELLFRVGDQRMPVTLTNQQLERIELGEVELKAAGYVALEVAGVRRDADHFAEIDQVVVSSDTSELKLDYVANNEGNMFYWGRRGPSVHLSYQVPRGATIEYGYSELTIPEGMDPIGSYFMANGFGEGYFGIQVNGPEERRVLFSVWSPFSTDNPRDIPEDQRIEMLAKGPEVRVGEFGNEGSGGQSFLVYPWKAGRTYRFLTRVQPDGKGSTIYTSWFGDKEANEWRLIASFRRPKTDTHLRGFHSFLENFNPETGNQTRLVNYSQVWVRDTTGTWHECREARFSVDPTGGNRHRLDFTGGSDGVSFYLRNCGFFSGDVDAGTRFNRDSSGNAPVIDLEQLPLD